MSHLTTFKNNSLINTKRDALQVAVAEIGLELDYNHKTVKNTWINESVDGCFKKDGKYIAVGVRFSTNAEGQEEVTVAGDFYGTGLNQREITDRIAQVYQKNRIIDLCQESRWSLDGDVVTKENGDMEMTFFRYA